VGLLTFYLRIEGLVPRAGDAKSNAVRREIMRKKKNPHFSQRTREMGHPGFGLLELRYVYS